jgi:uncharacterized protein (UPF0147 family)
MLEAVKRTPRSSKKTRQREQLILALLQQPSLEKAAESVGISRSTAWRISQTAEFQEEFRQARREALSQARARLQQASSAAVTTLVKIMIDPNLPAASRVRAADCILHHAVAALMSEDVLVRLQRVEQITIQTERNKEAA